MSGRSSPFPSCFRPPTVSDHDHCPPSAFPSLSPIPPISGQSNLATCIYHTHVALFSVSWSSSGLSRSLHIHFQPNNHPLCSTPFLSSTPSLHLRVKSFLFWNKNGSKILTPSVRIFWDFTRVKFGRGPEPRSGFYLAAVIDGEMALLIGDLTKEAYAGTKALNPQSHCFQALVLKREHVIANKIYITEARFCGKTREIQIDWGYNDGSKLSFSVDGKKVLQIKRLRWKFRGNETVELEGSPVQISWDVYNWVFGKEKNDGRAVFMFRFEEDEENESSTGQKNRASPWTKPQIWNAGMEWRKTRKSLSWSSMSMSSAGSSAGSSVMEWACNSMEESDLYSGPCGFSLLVYAWKKKV